MQFPYDFDNVEACIFDLDGTLLDSMHIWQEVDRKYLQRYGIIFDSKFSEEIKTMTFNESATYFIDKFQIPRTKEEIMEDWNEMVEIEYRENILLKEGVQSVLERLASANIKMCVATSCDRNHALMALKRLDILQYFSFVKTSKEVGRNKQFPDIYLACSKEMKSSIAKTLVFEDLLTALKVAKKEGFQTCGIHDMLSTHEKEEIKQHCDRFIYSFNEL